jgi:hypothetical protein
LIPYRKFLFFRKRIPHGCHLEMQVCANSRVLAPDAGKALVKALCETLEMFANNLDMVLPLPRWS